MRIKHVDSRCIRHRTIHLQYYVYFAGATQLDGQFHHDLVQAILDRIRSHEQNQHRLSRDEDSHVTR